VSRFVALAARPWVAVLLLVLVYMGVALTLDERAYLGTDTGAKVAALRALEGTDLAGPDLGYWAEEYDPEGTVHAFYYVDQFEEGWFDLSTLPLVYAAYPLWRLGGYKATLVIPALAAAVAAAAVVALVKRLGGRGGRAFWLAGLGTPLFVYALDLWDHAPGLALLLCATVLLVDISEGRRGVAWGLLVGVGVGVAATMRTEALLYGAALTGAVSLRLLVAGPFDDEPSEEDGAAGRGRDDTVNSVRTRLGRGIGLGVLALVGLIPPLVLNAMAERAVLGSDLRVDRTSGIAQSAGSGLEQRLDEGLRTLVGLPGLDPREAAIIGGLAVILLAVGLRSWGRRDDRLPQVAVVGWAAVLLLSLRDGLGFVPGLLTASPLAVLGVALLRRATGPAALLGGVALGALPLVWLTQFLGGAAPQWGARYALLSGLLLTVVALANLDHVAPGAQRAVAVAAVVITLLGVSWTYQRSHEFGRMGLAIAEADGVVISRVAHFLRENGWHYSPDRRWLTALGVEEERTAFAVAAASDAALVTVVELDGGDVNEVRDDRRRGEGWRRIDERSFFLFDDIEVRFASYARDQPARASAAPSA